MENTRKHRFVGKPIGTLLTIAILVLSGCGGGGGSSVSTKSIAVDGGQVQQNVGSADANVTAASVSQQVQVTVGGVSESAQLPATFAITMGQPLCVLSDQNPIFVGLTSPNAPNGTRRSNMGGDILIYLYGTSTALDTGVYITKDGKLSAPLVIPDGHYTVYVTGPLYIERDSARLDISTGIVFNCYVRSSVASLPVSMSGNIPANGSSTSTLQINATLPSVYGGGDAQLLIEHANGSLSQTKPVNSAGMVSFHDLESTGGSVIPSQGIDKFTFTYDDHISG